jgi:adenylate kinase family enzyme
LEAKRIEAGEAGALKIYVIGPSAAGKTRLARRLGERLDLPVYDLDRIAYTDYKWTVRPRADKLLAVEQILSQPGWIAEGGHLGWTEPLLEAADLIVWLDVPLRTTLARRNRRLRRKPIRFQIEQAWWQIRWYVLPYWAGQDLDRLPSRAATYHFLKKRMAKVRRYRRNPSVDLVEAALQGV